MKTLIETVIDPSEKILALQEDMVKEIYKKVIRLIIPISFTISVIIFFLSPYMARYIFHKEYLSNYFRIISIGIIPYVLFIINSESLRGLKKIKEYAFLQNLGISFTASVFLGLSLIIIKNSYMPVTIYAAAILIMALLSSFLWFKKFRSANLPASTQTYQNFDFTSKSSEAFNSTVTTDHLSPPDNISYKYILSVSTPMLISGSLSVFLGLIDITILGILKTSSEVGIYSVAVKLSSVAMMALVAINTIAAPKFAEFWGKGDKKGLTKIAQQSTKLIFWTSLPVLLVFLIFPSSILEIFGPGFKVGAIALIMLTIGQFINAISGSVGYILAMTGFQVFLQNGMIASIIINIILNLLLVPKYGINGAAFASMITLIFWNIIFSMKVKSILGEWIFYKPFRF
jgi:O-antigen/teichoic acid export membrane protein